MGLMKTITGSVKNPKRTLYRLETVLLEHFISARNALSDLRRRRRAQLQSGLGVFDEILERSQARTDISDHLQTLFVESMPVRPSLIVELGVRGGESTFVLERVAELHQAQLVSVDIQDCSRVSRYPNWSFVKSDDIAFAGEFAAWCREHGTEPLIDILFIDSSHELDHTVQELIHWFPFLSDRAKVFFHDTNMKRVFKRRDGSIGLGWANQRGVIAAIEQYLGCSFDEQRDFTAFVEGWMVKHHANCSGLTILEKAQNIAVSRLHHESVVRA
ncbi:MAG TPA: class I SAM-dependent methyltransferase [Terriglobales bacterium]|nr:class I SAM-dependent methyltransferase [Terriglobales bacterium]